MRAAIPAPPELLLVSGPPTGPALFRVVTARLGRGEAISVLDPADPTAGWRERGAALARRIVRGRTTLVAHGLAVPAAVAAALDVPPALLVLANGPITRLDPVTGALARLASAGGLPPFLLRPSLWLRWLASSAGLRRAVVNPYAMDRDTVALLCEQEVATPEGRRAMVAYLGSLAGALPDARSLSCKTVLLWGDEDPLYPASEADWLATSRVDSRHLPVPGGRFLYPEERPWWMADALRDVLSDQGLTARR